MLGKDCRNLRSEAARRGRFVSGVLAALAVMVLSRPTDGATVRVLPTSTVDAAVIRVSDVSEVLGAEPNQARRYGEVALCPAPKPGKAIEVSVGDVRRALVGAGANPVEFLMRGATRCRVTRPLTLHVHKPEQRTRALARMWWPTSEAELARAEEALAAARARQAAEQAAVSQPSGGDPGDTLEAAVRAFVKEKVASLGGRPHLRFSTNATKVLSLSRPEYGFNIHWTSERLLGHCGVTVEILKDGKLQQTVPMIVEVSITLPVVVAARPINRGQTIRAEDVTLEDRDFFHMDRIAVTELPAVVGQVSRRLIRKGEMLHHRDLRDRPLVHRGDVVTITSEVGRFRVRTAVKALDNGSYGEVIEVRNETSGERFRAIVTGEKTVRACGAGQGVAPTTLAQKGRS